MKRDLTSTLDHRERQGIRIRAGCEISILLQLERTQGTRSLPVLSVRVSITVCGFARSFTTKEWMTAGRSLRKKKLCFRCLASDHRGKYCTKARVCGLDGCSRNHHRLLHGSEVLSETGPMTTLSDGRRPDVPREGAPAVTMTSCNAETPAESYSLRTVAVWMKANGRKVKINAILDDASNESFLNEEVAGVLGLQEPFEKVQVYVLNDTVETFQSMPLKIEIKVSMGDFQRKSASKRVRGKSQAITEL